MVLIEENESAWIKTCLSATWSTTNSKKTIVGMNMFFCGERLMTNSLRHGMAHFSALSVVYQNVGVHPEFFTGEGSDPEAMHNLCFILKIMLLNSLAICRVYMLIISN
jgi:hypothetical protein